MGFFDDLGGALGQVGKVTGKVADRGLTFGEKAFFSFTPQGFFSGFAEAASANPFGSFMLIGGAILLVVLVAPILLNVLLK